MEKENLDKDFMKEQLYDNQNTFKPGWDYYKNIFKIIDKYILNMRQITAFFNDDNLKLLGFII